MVPDAEPLGQNGSGAPEENKGSGSRVPGVVGKILELKKRRQQYNSQQQFLANQQIPTTGTEGQGTQTRYTGTEGAGYSN